MLNLGSKKMRKVISSIVIVVIVLVMVGGMVLAGLAM